MMVKIMTVSSRSSGCGVSFLQLVDRQQAAVFDFDLSSAHIVTVFLISVP